MGWRAPRDDGRSAITGYKIYLYVDDKWKCIKTVDGNTFKYKVQDNIKEGGKYFFRITAVNVLGESTPLDSDMYAPKKEKGIIQRYILITFSQPCVIGHLSAPS